MEEAVRTMEEYSYQYNFKIAGLQSIDNPRESIEATEELCLRLSKAMGIKEISQYDIDIAHRV